MHAGLGGEAIHAGFDAVEAEADELAHAEDTEVEEVDAEGEPSGEEAAGDGFAGGDLRQPRGEGGGADAHPPVNEGDGTQIELGLRRGGGVQVHLLLDEEGIQLRPGVGAPPNAEVSGGGGLLPDSVQGGGAIRGAQHGMKQGKTAPADTIPKHLHPQREEGFLRQSGTTNDGRGAGGDEVSLQEPVDGVEGGFFRGSGDEVRIFDIRHAGVAGGVPIVLRVLLEEGEGAFEVIRQPGVIAIQEGDELAAGFSDGAVASRAFAAVGLVDDAQAGVGLGLEDLEGAVRGAIIHDDNFKILNGLLVNAAEGLFDIRLDLISRNSDTEERF